MGKKQSDTKPKNIQYYSDLLEEGLQPGDRIHLGVCGPGEVTDDAYYVGPVEPWHSFSDPRLPTSNGIRISIGKREIDLAWGDIIELWAIPRSPLLPAEG